MAHQAGKASTFVAALALLVVWAVSGPLFGWSDTWQLIINTGTTIITFLMVFLIQNTQNRDTEALHLKLDELIHATKGARELGDGTGGQERGTARCRQGRASEKAARAATPSRQGQGDPELRDPASHPRSRTNPEGAGEDYDMTELHAAILEIEHRLSGACD